MQNDALFSRRMIDLSREAYQGGYYTASGFLTLAEQGELDLLFKKGEIGTYTLEGGFESAERRLALFGSADAFGYEGTPPTVWLMLTPKVQKFADELSHRDILGALMSLGIKRERLGDILIDQNIGYLYLDESLAPYISENLTRIRHTDITVKAVETPPKIAIALPDETLIVTAGERLDALVAAVYKLSREKAQALCEGGLVALDGRICEKNAAPVKEGVTVSVRGFGRFRYEGVRADTKKGKLRSAVRIFS